MVDCPQYPRPISLSWRRPRLSLPSQLRHLPLVLLGLLCFSAPPCIGRNCHRKRQPECVYNLKGFFTSLMTQQSREGFSPLTVDKVTYLPERGNRYAYFLDKGYLEARTSPEPQRVVGAVGIGIDLDQHKDARPLTLDDLPPALAKEVGVNGTCPNCEFVIACAGDTDKNPMDTPDIWSIATVDRLIDGVPVSVGEPYHHVDDNETD